MTEDKRKIIIPGLEGALVHEDGLFSGMSQRTYHNSTQLTRKGELYVDCFIPRKSFSYDIVEEIGEAFNQANYHGSKPLLVVRVDPTSAKFVINQDIYFADLSNLEGIEDIIRIYLMNESVIPKDKRLGDDKLHILKKGLLNILNDHNRIIANRLKLINSDLEEAIKTGEIKDE